MAEGAPGVGVTSRAVALFEARRDELNERFRRGGAALSAPAMLGYLRRTALPILEGWQGEPTPAVLFALFDLGVSGLAAGLVGEADATPFERGLVVGMPKLEALAAAAPSVVLRALGNGYARIAREIGPRAADGWLGLVTSGAARCAERSALLDLGVVLAWRAGLAEAREVALERARGLDRRLLVEIFGTPELESSPHRRFCAPGAAGPLGPLAPLGPLELLGRVGGFVGFGGPFRRPPLPRVVLGRLVCTDGDVACELHADVFGARLRPAAWAYEGAMSSSDVGGARVDAAGTVQALGSTVACGDLRGAAAAAQALGMVAVTLADSHQVFVLGRREAAA